MLGRLWELCSGTHCTPPQSEAYRRLWDGTPHAPPGGCVHLAEPTGELRACPTCRGIVRLKVFHCHHPAHPSTTLPECLRCPDREE